jgi:assimilatory nitrate reductase catalytic subunit
VNPADAERLGLADGGFATVESRHGRLVTRVAADAGLRAGEVFLPMHWGRVFASTGPADALVDSVRDPVSGQPQFKLTPVRVAPVALPWRALLLTREALRPTGVDYYARARIAGGWRYRIAARQAPADMANWLRALIGAPAAKWQWLDYADPAGERRVLAVSGERAQFALFAGGDLDWLADDWLAAQFDAPLDAAARRALLAGVPGAAGADPGRTVCACFQVGINTIVRAIAEQGHASPQAIGAALKAGTNCGSCVPELRQILAAADRAA